MIDDNGAVFVTLFGKGLDFTNKLDRSLINPNQCISFGLQCVNGPTDPTRKLLFYANNVFLTIFMQGTNYLEGSFCLSDD